MVYLGDYAINAIVYLKWTTNGANGASITRATNGTLRLYKNGSVTQRTSSSGVTDTEDFDGLTGVHYASIDLADNTDAGFYTAGSEYQVVLEGATIDGQVVNAVLAHFSIERSGAVYTARLWMIDDNGGTTDRYIMAFYRNGALITTVTSPKLTVTNAANTAMFTDKVPAIIGSTGAFQATATGAERLISGVAYTASLRATTDGAEQVFCVQPMGRDSA